MSLPLVGISEDDLNGYLFIHFPFGESMKRSLMKTEMRIISDVEEEIADIIKYKRYGKNYPYDDEKEWDEYRKEHCVISPYTLWRALGYDIRKKLEKMTPQQVEACMLNAQPGRFKARYKENKMLEYVGFNDIFRETVKSVLEDTSPLTDF